MSNYHNTCVGQKGRDDSLSGELCMTECGTETLWPTWGSGYACIVINCTHARSFLAVSFLWPSMPAVFYTSISGVLPKVSSLF